jgi:hypothetical protein
MIENDLYFPRGSTYSQGSDTMTLNSTRAQELEGTRCWAVDTVHGMGAPVELIVLRNRTGGDITVARKFLELKQDEAKSFGRQVDTFPADTAGAVALPLDDAYTIGAIIPENDLFYAIVKGPCDVLTGSNANVLTAGGAIGTAADGTITNAITGAAGNFVIGTLDFADAYINATVFRVLVDAGPLAQVPAAG